MNKSENINELATALAKCQGEMQPAVKDSTNPHFKSKFSSLYSVWESCRQPLSKYGLSVVQTMETINEKLHLTTTLLHTSGQWISSITPVISARNDAQGIGSALTYFKRYSLAALLGICTSDEDDDGEAAMPKESRKEKGSPVTQLISADKVKILEETAEQCDPLYIEKVLAYLKKDHNVKSLSQVREDLYSRILTGMKSNAESFEKNV